MQIYTLRNCTCEHIAYDCRLMQLHTSRKGGPHLKESQVYPMAYGRRMRHLHADWVAPGLIYNTMYHVVLEIERMINQ